ncbi:MAG: outer membrane beta-barrel protein [Crocinitomicaceae bacterium]
MKKLSLALLIFSLNVVTVKAQVWFDLGIKGGVGSGFLLNKTFNDDGRFNISPGFNYFVGGKVGINFGELVGITCDVDYGSYSYGFLQSEVPNKSNTETFKYNIAYKAINVAPMFRYTKETSYLELGPQFSFLRGQSIEDAANPSTAPDGEIAITNNLTGIIFGFGGHMVGNEKISLMAGLRFNYVFSNLTADDYSDTNFPFTNYPSISSSTKTSPINMQLVLELNYSLGYFVRASCGKRTAFLTF